MLPGMGHVLRQEVGALQGNQLQLSQQLQMVCWDEEQLSQPFCSTFAVHEQLSQATGNVGYAEPRQQDIHEFLIQLLEQLPEAVQDIFHFESHVHHCCVVCHTQKQVAPEPMSVLMLHPEQDQGFDALLCKDQEEKVVLGVNCDTCTMQMPHNDRMEYILGDQHNYLLVHLSMFDSHLERIPG